MGGEDVTVVEKRKANRDGVATWVWKVRSNTIPGTYPIVITGEISGLKHPIRSGRR